MIIDSRASFLIIPGNPLAHNPPMGCASGFPLEIHLRLIAFGSSIKLPSDPRADANTNTSANSNADANSNANASADSNATTNVNTTVCTNATNANTNANADY